MKISKTKISHSNIAGNDLIIVNDNKKIIRLLSEILRELKKKQTKKGKQ